MRNWSLCLESPWRVTIIPRMITDKGQTASRTLKRSWSNYREKEQCFANHYECHKPETLEGSEPAFLVLTAKVITGQLSTVDQVQTTD